MVFKEPKKGKKGRNLMTYMTLCLARPSRSRVDGHNPEVAMSRAITCPQCCMSGYALDEMIGKMVQCSGCGIRFLVLLNEFPADDNCSSEAITAEKPLLLGTWDQEVGIHLPQSDLSVRATPTPEICYSEAITASKPPHLGTGEQETGIQLPQRDERITELDVSRIVRREWLKVKIGCHLIDIGIFVALVGLFFSGMLPENGAALGFFLVLISIPLAAGMVICLAIPHMSAKATIAGSISCLAGFLTFEHHRFGGNWL